MKLNAALFLIGMSAAIAGAAELDFDKTFNAKGEAAQLNYSATYTVQGAEHKVEVWRDRDLRLKRRTDGKLETYIFKPRKRDEWSMVVLDLPRKIRTDIDRSNLYRIGHFTDWFSMSHSLSRPSGSYLLTELKTAPSGEKPLSACRWYALNRGGAVSNICWSSELRLPLLITDGGGVVQWRVTAASKSALPAAVFAINDTGFVKNDANADIHTD